MIFIITASIKGQIIENIPDYTISDSVKYLTVNFKGIEAWHGYLKTAVFRNATLNKTISVVLSSENSLVIDENTCYVPHEVIKSPGFTLSLFGIKGESIITTNEVAVKVRKSGYGDGAVPEEPTPTEYQQLVNISNDTKAVAQSVRDDADNGVFKGDRGEQGLQGIQGKPGADGYTPIKGIDYFTSADIDSLNIPIVDTAFLSTSDNAQSGKAVAEAILRSLGNINTILSTVVTGGAL